MLALKTVLAETDQVPVLVFDEIDTGVGGAVAAAMGTRLRKLGAYHQCSVSLICRRWPPKPSTT